MKNYSTKYWTKDSTHSWKKITYKTKDNTAFDATEAAILTLHETISKHLSLNHKVDIACRDVTKAFDKIWHTGLKYKITELGLHSCYEKTLSNYLTNRTASIKIGHISGPKFKLESGVPPGGMLISNTIQHICQRHPRAPRRHWLITICRRYHTNYSTTRQS